MPIETRIARRYLWMSRKRAHTVFLSIISILGLAVGVATLLFSLALLSGLQGQIKERLIASSPQILIEPAGKNTIDDADAIVAEGRRLGMRHVEPIVSGIGWGANDTAERGGRPMRIRSFIPGSEPAGDAASRPWIAEEGEPVIFLTRNYAATLGLNVGDMVTVVVPRTRLTPFGPAPVWRKYRVARILPPPASEERAGDGYLAEEEAESLFGISGPTSIEMYGPAEGAEEAQARLAEKFPAVQVKTWKEINRPLFLALRLEKIVMFATISLIIFVAALNLISSMSMLILEKRPAVGVLRTIGATERSVLSIFLQVGLLIGLAGTLLGNLFGLGAAWAANRYQLVPLPPDIYFITYLPFSIDLPDVIGVNAIAVFLSIIATWYPARIASRLDPIVAIREEA
ncbi:MAG TPA: ABC transporter permease [Thermoanaerobaculia bacterium]|nr:ABC transporter permease [Thermoanaerobaculia bacterium]